MNDRSENQSTPERTLPEPIVIPGGLSDRMKAEVNKMIREELLTPPARKRRASYQQKRRARNRGKK